MLRSLFEVQAPTPGDVIIQAQDSASNLLLDRQLTLSIVSTLLNHLETESEYALPLAEYSRGIAQEHTYLVKGILMFLPVKNLVKK